MCKNKFVVSLLLLIIILLIICVKVQSANILIVYHVPSKSHHILGESFARGLCAKGHKVTMISPFKFETVFNNCESILMEGVLEKMAKFQEMFQADQDRKFFTQFTQFQDIVELMVFNAFETEAVRSLLNSNRKYDLVVFDAFFNEAMFGIAHYFNAPVIICSSTLSTMVNHITGNPSPSSFVPNFMTTFSDDMTFFQRIQNTFGSLISIIILNCFIYPTQVRLYNKYYPNGPNLEQLISNVSLAFVNTQPLYESPRPYMPNMIPIGGFHVKEPEKLTKDVQEFLDDAKDGAIFMSLGSNVKSSDLPKESIDAIIKTFSKLKQKVIWKWEADDLPNKPVNVKIGKWFPQNDILAHPNIKLFITHGGLLSITETIIRGVPVIVIPFFGDQPANAANIVAQGYGLQILPENINEKSLQNTLKEIFTNPRYTQEVKRRSVIMNDPPMKPLDTAIYWIEHVLRHKHVKHLHSPATRLNTFQYLLIDVIAFCLVIIITFLSLIFCVIKYLCCKKTQNKIDKTKKKQ